MTKNFQYTSHEIEQSQIRDYGPRLNFTFRFVVSHHFKYPLDKSKLNKSLLNI